MLTPSGRLLKRSSHPEDRPAVYAAQFALSHACWLVTYPLAGWLITAFSPATALAGLALLAVAGMGGGLLLWPSDEADTLSHSHPDLPVGHPHLREQPSAVHRHTVMIDDLHPHWPSAR